MSFAFRQRSGQIDWSALKKLDLEDVVENCRLGDLQGIIDNVTFSEVSAHTLVNKDLSLHSTLINAMQLILEYLLHSQEMQSSVITKMHSKLAPIKKKKDKLETENIYLKEEVKLYKSQLSVLRKRISLMSKQSSKENEGNNSLENWDDFPSEEEMSKAMNAHLREKSIQTAPLEPLRDVDINTIDVSSPSRTQKKKESADVPTTTTSTSPSRVVADKDAQIAELQRQIGMLVAKVVADPLVHAQPSNASPYRKKARSSVDGDLGVARTSNEGSAATQLGEYQHMSSEIDEMIARTAGVALMGGPLSDFTNKSNNNTHPPKQANQKHHISAATLSEELEEELRTELASRAQRIKSKESDLEDKERRLAVLEKSILQSQLELQKQKYDHEVHCHQVDLQQASIGHQSPIRTTVATTSTSPIRSPMREEAGLASRGEMATSTTNLEAIKIREDEDRRAAEKEAEQIAADERSRSIAAKIVKAKFAQIRWKITQSRFRKWHNVMLDARDMEQFMERQAALEKVAALEQQTELAEKEMHAKEEDWAGKLQKEREQLKEREETEVKLREELEQQKYVIVMTSPTITFIITITITTTIISRWICASVMTNAFHARQMRLLSEITNILIQFV